MTSIIFSGLPADFEYGLDKTAPTLVLLDKIESIVTAQNRSSLYYGSRYVQVPQIDIVLLAEVLNHIQTTSELHDIVLWDDAVEQVAAKRVGKHATHAVGVIEPLI